MLDLDLARLAVGRDRSPEGLEGAVWSRVEALERLRRLLRLTTRVQLMALSAAVLVSIALGVAVAGGLTRPTAADQISSAAAELAPSTLLESPRS